MTDFFYCECPVCGSYGLIQGPKPPIITCPTCAQQHGQFVSLRMRPASSEEITEYEASLGRRSSMH